ncbi:MAG: beta-propeller domain-containing protein, partial [Acidimicrobiia bacterium]|nr:beta-propeller domain-containing protein [Acidimicrobiia bacterium]
MNKLWPIFLVVLVACSPAVQVAAPDDLDPAALMAWRLEAFDTCEELLTHIKSEASERVGPYGFGEWGPPWVLDERSSVETTAAAAEQAFAPIAGDAAAGGAASDVVDYQGTNTQELGIDEADIIKTDGRRILALVDSVLVMVDVTGQEPVVTDRLPFEAFAASDLFFQGDRAFVFTNNAYWGGPMPVDDAAVERGFAPEYIATAAIVEVDLSDPSKLSIAGKLELEGQYLSARAVGTTVRVAMTTPPASLPFVYPANPAGEERAEEVNRQVIAESTIEDWIPGYKLTEGGQESEGQLIECGQMYHPVDFAGFDVVSVLSL